MKLATVAVGDARPALLFVKRGDVCGSGVVVNGLWAE